MINSDYKNNYEGVLVKGENPSLGSKVAKIGDRDLLEGILHSRVFRAVLVSGIAVGILFAVTSPAGWLIAAVAASAFVAALFFPTGMTLQTLEFELSAAGRLMGAVGDNHNEILMGEVSTGIVLGSLPNQLDAKENEFFKKEIGAVLSVNETWERDPIGLCIPYRESDYKALGVQAYKEINALDHVPLSNKQLHQAANFIHDSLTKGKKVYVHCRAGKGRSAMAVAAYLIKYKGKTAEEAAQIIKASRPGSTINKKIKALKTFEHLNRLVKLANNA